MPFYFRDLLLGLALAALCAAPAEAGRFAGRIHDAADAPLAGVMVSISHGDPLHVVTVYTDESGRYRSPELEGASPYRIRVRRPLWRDVVVTGATLPAHGDASLDVTLERETDPAEITAQLPANRWFSLVLARVHDERSAKSWCDNAPTATSREASRRACFEPRRTGRRCWR